MLLKSITDAIWDESLWFPGVFAGRTYGWKDLQNEPGSNVYLPQIWDLHWSIVLGAFLVVFRSVLERLVITPIGYYLGIPRKRQYNVTPNPLLETAYKQNKKQDLQLLSKRTDWTPRQIEVWFRKRKKQDATPTIRKFCDSGWRFLFHTTSFTYGLFVLWNKPWFRSTRECWTDWPKQYISDDIYWYYMIELSYYWSLIFTLVSDHKRADFKQMLIHHIASIVLIYFSWLTNYVRIGTLVLVIHDASDPWLEIAKLGIYLKWKTATDVFFTIFVLVWTVARHFLLPYTVLFLTTFGYLEYIDKLTFAYYFFNFFLYLLMALSCIWSYHIYKMVFQKLRQGEVTDSRSDLDEDTSSDETNGCNESKNGMVKNGNFNNLQK
ncbi:ceramide synthase 2-like [Mercenaria mercenaria]|uniref:ceramide synthase 2-like n=1 Tax=Mercenaria mercenaria TaxID=6596 RepID=UPI00234F7462|nr:ceramide synthase 2-like [Mercenaria mercenaria]